MLPGHGAATQEDRVHKEPRLAPDSGAFKDDGRANAAGSQNNKIRGKELFMNPDPNLNPYGPAVANYDLRDAAAAAEVGTVSDSLIQKAAAVPLCSVGAAQYAAAAAPAAAEVYEFGRGARRKPHVLACLKQAPGDRGPPQVVGRACRHLAGELCEFFV